MHDANLAMILVSSSIPSWRAAYLEELGIRCVEIPTVPATEQERKSIQKELRSSNKKMKHRAEAEFILGDDFRISYEDVTNPAGRKGIAFAHYMLRNSLELIRKPFSEYDIVPFRATRQTSLDFDLEYDRSKNHGTNIFKRGGVWWAYRFGFSENLPPNDVPNISIIVNDIGLDVTLNAELLPSQTVMVDRIRRCTSELDRLIADHGWIWLKTYLKFEHQPRFYHWILADFMRPGEFDGAAILRLRLDHESNFWQEREYWVRKIIAENDELTKGLSRHLESKNKRLNLAIRLVEPIPKNAAFWSFTVGTQVSEIAKAVQRLKPLLDFFIK